MGIHAEYVTEISKVLCEEFPARCKRVNEMAAQQLLLDLHSLKNLFLKLPTVGQNETDEFKYVIPPT